MNALELFKAGQLTDALAEQLRQVTATPDDAVGWLFLAELQLYAGALDAVRQSLLRVSTDREGMADFLHNYAQLLIAEQKRQAAWSQGTPPTFLREPPEHALARWNAFVHLREQQLEEAMESLDEAESLTPHVTGHIDAREFEGVRDGADHLGSVLELLIEDNYVWLPFEEIRRLRLGVPNQPRDWLFIPAELRLRDGSEWVGYLPALYAGSHESADEAIRIGQETDWVEQADGSIRGLGAKFLSFGEEELTAWEWRQWE